MEWQYIAFLFIGLLFVGLLFGIRIFAVLMGLGVLGIYLFMNPWMDILLGYQTWHSLVMFVVAAVPLFIFMSEILVVSGVSSLMYEAAAPIFERLPGGLLHSNIGVCAILAATTGSLLTGTAAVGTAALPELKKRKYDPALVCGSLAIGGTLGTMIPPSITFIIIGALVGMSVGKLFIAGIIPGLMLAGLYMTYILVRALLQPKLAPKSAELKPLGSSLRGLLKVWPVAILVVVVLGSIYGGIATPTEAASLGCMIAMLVTLGYRRLTWEVLRKAAQQSFSATSMAIMLFLGAKLIGTPLANLGVFLRLTEWMIALPLQPLGILVSIYVMYFILGMFMSGLPVVVITLPLVWPILIGLGYDPIFIGVAIVMLSECGSITPPVGQLLYFIQVLAPDVPFKAVASGCLQFAAVLMGGLAILTAFPQLALFLPGMMEF